MNKLPHQQLVLPSFFSVAVFQLAAIGMLHPARGNLNGELQTGNLLS